MRSENTESVGDAPLYEAARKNYPAAVSGRFRTIKWTVLIITLGLYYLLPFIRWDRGPNAPDQAVLVDIAARRAYFFFIEIWPQEVYYLTGLLVMAAVTLFLMNAVAGRIWCGYLCPQTVWTDLYFAVERWIEGDGGPNNQMTKQAPGLCADCGYLIRLSGRLGRCFGVCANEFSPRDGSVVSIDHGCGAHSDVSDATHGVELPRPVWDTVTLDEMVLFD